VVDLEDHLDDLIIYMSAVYSFYTYLDFPFSSFHSVIHACIQAVGDHPEFNGSSVQLTTVKSSQVYDLLINIQLHFLL